MANWRDGRDPFRAAAGPHAQQRTTRGRAQMGDQPPRARTMRLDASAGRRTLLDATGVAGRQRREAPPRHVLDSVQMRVRRGDQPGRRLTRIWASRTLDPHGPPKLHRRRRHPVERLGRHSPVDRAPIGRGAAPRGRRPHGRSACPRAAATPARSARRGCRWCANSDCRRVIARVARLRVQARQATSCADPGRVGGAERSRARSPLRKGHSGARQAPAHRVIAAGTGELIRRLASARRIPLPGPDERATARRLPVRGAADTPRRARRHPNPSPFRR